MTTVAGRNDAVEQVDTTRDGIEQVLGPAEPHQVPRRGGRQLRVNFLDQVATRISSREYSELASKLDVGAVGGVVLAQVLEAEDDRELGLKLLTAVVSEGLMVLATRQHVRAWEGELAAVYRNAAWVLYPELWHWTVGLKPDLPALDRRKLLDDLLGPVHSDATSGFHKAILVGALFQDLLIGTVKAVASS